MWVFCDFVALYCVNFVTLFLLDVFKAAKIKNKLLSFLVYNHFGGIVEINAGRSVRQQVPQTIFRWVIHPFLDMNLWMSLFGLWNFRRCFLHSLIMWGFKVIADWWILFLFLVKFVCWRFTLNHISLGLVLCLVRAFELFCLLSLVAAFVLINEVLCRWAGQCATRNGFWNRLSCHEWILHDLVQAWSFRWVENQDSRDQVFSLLRYGYMFRERITANLDLFVGCFDFRCLKWRFPNQKCVNNNPHWPDINFIWMPFSLQYFWCNIVGSPTNGFFLFIIIL